ncbi:MAG: hypothetical protein IPL61_36320 [Myxococcales bacterium]|nr:hypothetical protein [Myxococcales bacterium]
MRIATTTLLLTLVTAAACSKSDATPRPPSPLVQGLEAAADESCACKDMTCSDAVNAKVEALAKGAGTIPPADLPALQAAQARIDGCRVALNPRLIAYRALLDEACACETPACATAVARKVSAWAAELKASKTTLRPGELKVVVAGAASASACFTEHGVAVPQ